jgi:hypothetical protein
MHLLEPARSAWFITNPTTTTSNWLNHSCTRTLSHFLGYPRCFNRSKYFNPLQPQRHTLSLNLAKSWDLGIASVTNVCVCYYVCSSSFLVENWNVLILPPGSSSTSVGKNPLNRWFWGLDTRNLSGTTGIEPVAQESKHTQSRPHWTCRFPAPYQSFDHCLSEVYLYSSRNLGVRQDKRREQPFVFYYWKVWGLRPKWGEKTPLKNMRKHGKLGK